jgi:putative MFS transporter
VSALGAPLGAVAASWIVDRFPRHVLFIACATCLILLGLGFALVQAPAAAMGFGLCYMVVSVIFTLVLSIYGAEMFPTLRRGTAQGLGQATNRLGAAAVPLVLLPLLRATDPLTLFAVIGGTLVVSIVLVGRFGPRSAVIEPDD